MNFEDYLKERPYKNTKAFTKDDWELHLYEIWTHLFNDQPIPFVYPTLRDYTITFSNGNSVSIPAKDYMSAKLKAVKSYEVGITEIASVL